MSHVRRPTLLAFAFLCMAGLPARAITADVEIDPTAYILSGYSLHAGIAYGRVRIDLGAYALAVPQFIHGNKSFDQSFDGFGVKLIYFLSEDRAGAFAGVDCGLARMRLRRVGTDLSSRTDQPGIGVNAGYRVVIGQGFYATPWVGLSYAFNVRDTVLEGQTFKGQHWSIFPAVHLGYRFQ